MSLWLYKDVLRPGHSFRLSHVDKLYIHTYTNSHPQVKIRTSHSIHLSHVDEFFIHTYTDSHPQVKYVLATLFICLTLMSCLFIPIQTVILR